VDVLRQVGAAVQSIAPIGGGCPDLLVGFRDRNYVLEIKMPGSERRLTEKERVWIRNWRGQVNVVTSVEDALAVIGAR
jgi:hypothetical protein